MRGAARPCAGPWPSCAAGLTCLSEGGRIALRASCRSRQLWALAYHIRNRSWPCLYVGRSRIWDHWYRRILRSGRGWSIQRSRMEESGGRGGRRQVLHRGEEGRALQGDCGTLLLSTLSRASLGRMGRHTCVSGGWLRRPCGRGASSSRGHEGRG